jgi:hypothetical protein
MAGDQGLTEANAEHPTSNVERPMGDTNARYLLFN